MTNPSRFRWTVLVSLACHAAGMGDLEILPYILTNLGMSKDKVAHYRVLKAENCAGDITNEVGLDAQCHVKGIYLRHSGLVGYLVPEIGHLKEVEDIDLRDNGLSGSIPKEIKQLKVLAHLDLSCNQFTGEIPPMPAQLEELYLFNNLLSGSVRIGHLERLEYLDLAGNQLTDFPDFEDMPLLLELRMSRNRIRGPLPQLCDKDNRILQHVELDSNQLTGTLEILENCTALYYLNLAFNQLEGELPRLGGGISWLLLNDNLLNGTIPEEIIGKLDELERLELQNNSFTGRIPENLGVLKWLKRLDLSNNRFFGPVPKSLANLKDLTTLRLSSNALSGLLPDVTNLVGLQHVHLGHNGFKGEFPRAFCAMPNLESLHLRGNSFEGDLPEECFREASNFSNLKELLLNNNFFTGQIPHVAHLPNLTVLTMHRNWFQGDLPDLNRTSNLSVLTFHDNRLNGSIRALDLHYSCMDDTQFQFSGHSCEDVGAAVERWREWWRFKNGCEIFSTEYKVDIGLLLRHCPWTCNACDTGALKPKATFHANRLSCKVPTRVTESNQSVTALVVMGNMLGRGEKLDAAWILKAEQQEFLYFSAEKWKKHKKIAMLFSILALLSSIAASSFIRGLRARRQQGSESARIAEAYFQALLITSCIAIFSLLLLPAYLFGSNYYRCGQEFSRMTAAYLDRSPMSERLVVLCWCCLAVVFRVAAMTFPKLEVLAQRHLRRGLRWE